MQKNPGVSGEPIGVFDSGIGGLTVLKALQDKYPNESYVYIGDTARLPYGTKSPETVIRYSETLTKAIMAHHVRAIVVACNTASTHALEAVKFIAGNIPVLGMIEPAARAALSKTKSNHIGVIATYGTIRSGIYEKTLKNLNSALRVSSQATQMLVALAEEGWAENEISDLALHKYLDPMFNQKGAPDTLILGCTHFPLFEKQLQKILGNKVSLINSGAAAANELNLDENKVQGGVKFYATDDASRFAANAEKFFGRRILSNEVELIDI